MTEEPLFEIVPNPDSKPKVAPTMQEQLQNANGPIRGAVHEGLQLNYDKIRELSAQMRADEILEHERLNALEESIQNEINIEQFVGSSFYFYYLKPLGRAIVPHMRLFALGNHYEIESTAHNAVQSIVFVS